MNWHDLRDPNDPELDVLAERYHLHPLHIEDCRHGHQRAKVEEGADYIFVGAQAGTRDRCRGEVNITDFDLFLGRDYLITVRRAIARACGSYLDKLRAGRINRAGPALLQNRGRHRRCILAGPRLVQ